MHASTLISLALVFSAALVAAAPLASSTAPHLQRRQLNPLTLGLGAGAVHKQKDNEKIVQEYRAELNDLTQQVAALKATELTLQRVFVPLRRRQLGTILGAVGIHKSKHTRQDIEVFHEQIGMLRHDVDMLLEQEHLGPGNRALMEDGAHELDEQGGPVESGFTDESAAMEEVGPGGDQHRLVRRQLGIILSPIALHKARKDRKALDALLPVIQGLRVDCTRIKAAQDARLLNMHRRQTNTFVDVSMHGNGAGRPTGMNGGVLAANNHRDDLAHDDFDNEDDLHHDEDDVHHDDVHSGATYGNGHAPVHTTTYGSGHAPVHRPTTYGAPTY